MNPNSKKYYVYEWFVKNTGEVFYVGKGCKRRWKTTARENKFFTHMLLTHECDVRKVHERLTECEAYEMEIKTIQYYRNNTNYRLTNVTDGGDDPPTFYGDASPSRRPEVREKISQSNKTNWKDRDYQLKMGRAFKEFYATDKGQAVSSARSKKNWDNDETRAKIINNMCATVKSDEYKIIHSARMKKAYASEEVREKVRGANNGTSRRIAQYDLDGNLINRYVTLMEAQNKTGMSFKNISKALHGHRKTAYGYIWKIDDDKDIVYKKRAEYNKDINRKRKPIFQYDLQGNFLNEYESVASATTQNNLPNHTNIICNLKGRTKHAYGSVWKYKE
jgi:hypothetical protein